MRQGSGEAATRHLPVTPGPSGRTFSFLHAKAAALFSASALRRPLATKVMGQGQSRVRVDSLVLVPTVWNCMRFYGEGGQAVREGRGRERPALPRCRGTRPRSPPSSAPGEAPLQPRTSVGHATLCPLSTVKANRCGGSWGLTCCVCPTGHVRGDRKAWRPAPPDHSPSPAAETELTPQQDSRPPALPATRDRVQASRPRSPQPAARAPDSRCVPAAPPSRTPLAPPLPRHEEKRAQPTQLPTHAHPWETPLTLAVEEEVAI